MKYVVKLQLIKEREKIQTIRSIITLTQTGLKEAKDLVECTNTTSMRGIEVNSHEFGDLMYRYLTTPIIHEYVKVVRVTVLEEW